MPAAESGYQLCCFVCGLFLWLFFFFCQKYLSTGNWSNAKARRFSQLGGQETMGFFAEKVAAWFISNSFVSFLRLTLLLSIFLRCSVITFIL